MDITNVLVELPHSQDKTTDCLILKIFTVWCDFNDLNVYFFIKICGK